MPRSRGRLNQTCPVSPSATPTFTAPVHTWSRHMLSSDIGEEACESSGPTPGVLDTLVLRPAAASGPWDWRNWSTTGRGVYHILFNFYDGRKATL
jgi:hypothetical protein